MPRTKLTPDAIEDITQRIARGETRQRVADRHGISKTYVMKIASGAQTPSRPKMTDEDEREFLRRYRRLGRRSNVRALAAEYGITQSYAFKLVRDTDAQVAAIDDALTPLGTQRLTPEAVIEIRRQYATGQVSMRTLAETYGITKQYVQRILHRQAWADLPPGTPNEDYLIRRISKRNNRSASHLTDDDVREIRLRYAAGGESYRQLAEAYGISTTNVQAIVQRQTWKHVE